MKLAVDQKIQIQEQVWLEPPKTREEMYLKGWKACLACIRPWVQTRKKKKKVRLGLWLGALQMWRGRRAVSSQGCAGGMKPALQGTRLPVTPQRRPSTSTNHWALPGKAEAWACSESPCSPQSPDPAPFPRTQLSEPRACGSLLGLSLSCLRLKRSISEPWGLPQAPAPTQNPPAACLAAASSIKGPERGAGTPHSR